MIIELRPIWAITPRLQIVTGILSNLILKIFHPAGEPEASIYGVIPPPADGSELSAEGGRP